MRRTLRGCRYSRSLCCCRVLYVAIRYAYLGRILVKWQLPEGWVSVLLLALAVAGILALLLIHPLR